LEPSGSSQDHLLSLLKNLIFFASLAGAGLLWMLACLLVIRSKKRSHLWLFLAALGPFGFAVLAMLSDLAPAETDMYARFVHSLTGFVRVGYEVCTFVIVSVLAYQAMVLQRTLMIWYESATTGFSNVRVMSVQNASAGMWAFAEGNEVMFLVAVLYLLRPIAFSIVSQMASLRAR
jgi:hypothetical protein